MVRVWSILPDFRTHGHRSNDANEVFSYEPVADPNSVRQAPIPLVALHLLTGMACDE